MSDHGLGLLIDDKHEATINSFREVPVAFGAAPGDLPPKWVPPLIIESQGNTNSCAGHSEALACAHANYVATGEVKRFSRRFAYITAQARGGFLGRDGGTSITSTLDAASADGCCLESTCPFVNAYDTHISTAARAEAAKHRHHGETRYDCRQLATAISWLTDKRCIVIGTRWHGGQDQCSGIEDRNCGTSGRFRGYHARLLVGWDTHSGTLVPVCQNSHGSQWANEGRSIITPDLWEWWQQDPYFFALGFNRIDEVEPARRDWKESRPGDTC